MDRPRQIPKVTTKIKRWIIHLFIFFKSVYSIISFIHHIRVITKQCTPLDVGDRKGEIVMKKYNLNQVTVNIRTIVDEGDGSTTDVIEVIDDYNDGDVIARKEITLDQLKDWATQVHDAIGQFGTGMIPMYVKMSKGSLYFKYKRRSGRSHNFGITSEPETCPLDFNVDDVIIKASLSEVNEIFREGAMNMAMGMLHKFKFNF